MILERERTKAGRVREKRERAVHVVERGGYWESCHVLPLQQMWATTAVFRGDLNLPTKCSNGLNNRLKTAIVHMSLLFRGGFYVQRGKVG